MRLSVDDPSYNKISAQNLVAWSHPKRNAQRESFAALAGRKWSPERLANFRQKRAQYPPEVFAMVEEHLKTHGRQLGVKAIAAMFNVSESFVENRAQALGIRRKIAAPVTKEKHDDMAPLLLAQAKTQTMQFKDMAALCGVTEAQLSRVQKELKINFRNWAPSKTAAYLSDIQSLLPSLSDADMVKMLEEAGLLPTLLLKTKGGIAEVLRSLRAGELPAQNGGGDNGVVDESDYVSPDTVIDPDAADRAKRSGASEKVITHVSRARSRPCGPNGFVKVIHRTY